MAAADELVFLLDCDNTLLDNDRVIDDLRARLVREFGPEGRDRYWKNLAALHDELGYADYLGALQRYRLGAMNDPRSMRTRFPPIRRPTSPSSASAICSITIFPL